MLNKREIKELSHLNYWKLINDIILDWGLILFGILIAILIRTWVSYLIAILIIGNSQKKDGTGVK